MGKIRTKLIGLEEVEEKQKKEARVKREEKKKREGIKVRPTGGKGGERMKQVAVGEEALAKMEKAKKILEDKDAKLRENEKTLKDAKKIRVRRARGKNYQEAKKKIDKNKKYTVKNAVSLLKKIKFSKFDETVELHINVRENGLKGEIVFPHGIGKETRVTIVDEKILAQIEKGNFNFDVLIAHPSFMPKLVRFAKILGPKGLMPNPKTGTISQNPEEAAKKFKSGLIHFKTEAKFPIIHQVVGKLSFKDQALVENVVTLLKAIGTSKIELAFLKSTMSPAIKIQLQ